ncbi:ABC transporter permease [Candidatus Bipolaricaulota bacterium]|jgi:ABC-type dipeptide/oligopeptide/nickel transport system permease subunit|nr:ABC transporter permease [Candidatus Bipolaricaulota bacterium]
MEFKRFWKLYRKNRAAVIGLILTIFFLVMAIFAPFIAPRDPNTGKLTERLSPPFWMKGGSARHLLGTDSLGRDILSRVIYGSRISILIGIVVVSVASIMGVLIGLVSGYFGGKIDAIIQRIVDTLLAFPYLIFALAIMSVLGPGLKNIVLALVYKEWVTPCRVIRGDTLVAKEENYVEAARAMGASNRHILLRSLLPNVMASVIVVASLRIGWVVLMEASLSFLGLGVQPPTATWGGMVAGGRDYIFQAWWITTFPGIAIFLLVMGVNLMGEGLRDAFDPKLTRGNK